ncbi:hypothetical protein [Hyphomicrobium sp.]|jgi:hypothetical protein|uniref:hypothetical protein n=1 Tax=Hyphomicrobium sp. TaxID=82 RepID=UPI0035640AD6
MLLRALALLSGFGIIGAMVHVAVVASGGYDAPTAPLFIAVGLGLCVGSLCVGAAQRDRRWPLAAFIIATLAAGEGYAIITTSETTIATRDAAAAPLEAAEKARIESQGRVANAEQAKARADAAAISEAPKPGCRHECRILLEGAKADARRELDAARLAFNAMPAPRSATPLADRLHVDASSLDLLAAVLRSLAVNGLGGALIAFGAHGGGSTARRKRARPRAVASREAKSLPLSSPSTASATVLVSVKSIERPTAREHALHFSRDVLAPAATDTPLAKLHSAYHNWCEALGEEPYAAREIGAEMAALFERTGIEVIEVDGTRFVSRARIKGARSKVVLGPITRADATA